MSEKQIFGGFERRRVLFVIKQVLDDSRLRVGDEAFLFVKIAKLAVFIGHGEDLFHLIGGMTRGHRLGAV